MKTAVLAIVALAGWMGIAQAESPQRFNDDFNATQESGPPVVSGNGATSGPNFKNQATLPMPGKELSDRTRETLPAPETPTIVVPPPPRRPPPVQQ